MNSFPTRRLAKSLPGTRRSTIRPRAFETVVADGQEGIRWSSRDLTLPILKRATELFADGLTVREVAAALRISKTEAGRLRIRAFNDGLLTPDERPKLNNRQIMVQ